MLYASKEMNEEMKAKSKKGEREARGLRVANI